jgi:hypothetical protein
MDQQDDGEAERRRKLELTGVMVRSFRCTRAELGRLGSTSGSRRLSHPIYKDINRAIIYVPGSSHAHIQ